MALLPMGLVAQEKVIHDENIVERIVPYFHSIKVNSAINLYLSQSDEQKVLVSANDKEWVEDLTTVVKDSVLYIGFKVMKVRNNLKLNAYVSYTTLKMLHASGAARTEFVDELKQPSLDLSLGGASSMQAKLDVESLTIKLSGASDLRVKGKSDRAYISASGASSYKGYDFVINELTLSAAGASDIQVHNNKEMNISASGASDIKWKGNGVIRTSSIGGASNLKKVNK